MNRWKKRMLENKEQAAALVIAIILLTAMELLGFALAILSEIDVSVAANVVRNEDAAYWADMGLNIAIDAAKDSTLNPTTSKFGAMQFLAKKEISSADLNGRYIYAAGTDPYPRFNCSVIWYDVTAPGEGQRAGIMSPVYRAYCQGESSSGLIRKAQAEFSLNNTGTEKGGYKFGSGRKLADATYLGL